jgi:hypothetical protein
VKSCEVFEIAMPGMSENMLLNASVSQLPGLLTIDRQLVLVDCMGSVLIKVFSLQVLVLFALVDDMRERSLRVCMSEL